MRLAANNIWSLILVALVWIGLSSQAAAGTIIFEDDFSNFSGWSPNAGIVFTENGDTVTLNGVGTGFNAAVSNTILPLAGLEAITLEHTASSGTFNLLGLYLDAGSVFIDFQVLLSSPSPGTNIVPGASLVPPAGAVSLQFDFALGEGASATVDHLSVSVIPEPATLPLLAFAVGLLAYHAWRRPRCTWKS